MADPSIERAKNGAYPLLARMEAALEAGEIDEAGWYREVAAVITPAYLAGGNPRAQSGHSGDDARWRTAREIIVDGVHRDGTFLDVGCASGYLMECLVPWADERGLALEPYGLDIAPELADLARRRVPHWAGSIWTGNAIDWPPPMRFFFVRTGLEYVPRRRQPDLVARLLRDVTAPGGRLIIGTYNEERPDLLAGPSLEEQVSAWGFRVAGRSSRPKPTDERILYRVMWLDRP